MIPKEGLYLGWQRSQASGAMVGWCSGEATRCRQNRDADEDDRGPSGPLHRALLLHKKAIGYCLFKISAAPPLHGEVPKTCKKHVTKANNHIYTKHGHEGQQPPIYQEEPCILVLFPFRWKYWSSTTIITTNPATTTKTTTNNYLTTNNANSKNYLTINNNYY